MCPSLLSSAPQVGDPVEWTTPVGVHYAGIVRYIPAWAPTVLHITCDPKRCTEDHGMTHVARADICTSPNPTLF